MRSKIALTMVAWTLPWTATLWAAFVIAAARLYARQP
jgi:hypothetical protein